MFVVHVLWELQSLWDVGWNLDRRVVNVLVVLPKLFLIELADRDLGVSVLGHQLGYPLLFWSEVGFDVVDLRPSEALFSVQLVHHRRQMRLPLLAQYVDVLHRLLLVLAVVVDPEDDVVVEGVFEVVLDHPVDQPFVRKPKQLVGAVVRQLLVVSPHGLLQATVDLGDSVIFRSFHSHIHRQ